MISILHLPFYEIELRPDPISSYNVIDTESNKVPGNKRVIVHHTKLKITLFDFEIDERFNTFKSSGISSPISRELESKFYELKKSNPSYGNITGKTQGGDVYQYEGTEHLFVETFFDYLKSVNREQIINKVINN